MVIKCLGKSKPSRVEPRITFPLSFDLRKRRGQERRTLSALSFYFPCVCLWLWAENVNFWSGRPIVRCNLGPVPFEIELVVSDVKGRCQSVPILRTSKRQWFHPKRTFTCGGFEFVQNNFTCREHRSPLYRHFREIQFFGENITQWPAARWSRVGWCKGNETLVVCVPKFHESSWAAVALACWRCAPENFVNLLKAFTKRQTSDTDFCNCHLNLSCEAVWQKTSQNMSACTGSLPRSIFGVRIQLHNVYTGIIVRSRNARIYNVMKQRATIHLQGINSSRHVIKTNPSDIACNHVSEWKQIDLDEENLTS